MTTSLASLIHDLDTHPGRVPLDELTASLGRLEVSRDELEPYRRFSESGYQRNMIHEGPGYEILLLCWEAGQHSPIHDHVGSTCGLYVIEGTATETIYKRGRDGMLMAARSHLIPEGRICGSQDDDIHQVSNFQEDGSRLVTLHIYTPQLRKMNSYSLTDSIVREYRMPVHAFSHVSHGEGI